MEFSTCETCGGQGIEMVTRSRWIGGSRNGYDSVWTGAVRCEDCHGSGEVPAVTCESCGEMVPKDSAVPTVDGEGFICEPCYEMEQEEILAANPDLAWLVPYKGGHVA